MIVVTISRAFRKISYPSTAIRRTAEFVCRRERVKNAEFSFVLVDDRSIRRINKKFLNHNYVTDVITFPLEQDEVNAEIYVNAQQARRQAKELGITVRNELTRLVVHGTLHAIGYDDSTKKSKKRMDSIQERYVSELSLS
jgi:probable rRNA maturation factor